MIIVGLDLLLSRMPFLAQNVWEMYGEIWAPEEKNTLIFGENDPKNGPKMPFLRPISTKSVILSNKNAFEVHWAHIGPLGRVPVRSYVHQSFFPGTGFIIITQQLLSRGKLLSRA